LNEFFKDAIAFLKIKLTFNNFYFFIFELRHDCKRRIVCQVYHSLFYKFFLVASCTTLELDWVEEYGVALSMFGVITNPCVVELGCAQDCDGYFVIETTTQSMTWIIIIIIQGWSAYHISLSASMSQQKIFTSENTLKMIAEE